jgi:hypothetical protein
MNRVLNCTLSPIKPCYEAGNHYRGENMKVLELDMDSCPFNTQPADYIVCSDCPYCLEVDDFACKCTYEEEDNEI